MQLDTYKPYKAVMQSHPLYRHISGGPFRKIVKRGQKLMVEKLWEGITSLVPTPHIALASSKGGRGFGKRGGKCPLRSPTKWSPGIFAKTRPNQTCWSDYIRRGGLPSPSQMHQGAGMSNQWATGLDIVQDENHPLWAVAFLPICTHSLYFTCTMYMTKSPTPCLLDVA